MHAVKLLFYEDMHEGKEGENIIMKRRTQNHIVAKLAKTREISPFSQRKQACVRIATVIFNWQRGGLVHLYEKVVCPLVQLRALLGKCDCYNFRICKASGFRGFHLLLLPDTYRDDQSTSMLFYANQYELICIVTSRFFSKL